MGFESLLGNERLKQNLSESIARGHISHFYILSGPKGSGKHTLARLMAAAIHCKRGRRPCLACDSCRKVMAGSHPDFLTVDDPEKKTVSVETIRNARADIYVQPNESDFKVYLFPRAQDMGIPGQNALLKVLEEPPKYGVFLLLTDNPEKLLPTVRSRCRELKMQTLDMALLEGELKRRFPQAADQDIRAAAARSGGFLGQALELLESGGEVSKQTRDLVRALADQDELLLAMTLTPMEKLKRDALAEILISLQELLSQALLSRSGMEALSPLARELARKRTARDLRQALQAVNKGLEYASGNVSPGAVCGWLRWEL